MKHNFDIIVPETVFMEGGNRADGGFNNRKNDRGGATKFGISLRFLRSVGKDIDGDGDIDYIDIQKLDKEKAIELYRIYFWRKEYDQLNINIAAKMFDMNVNMGTKPACKILQRALRDLGFSGIKADGIIGPRTVLAANTVKNKQGLLELMCEKQWEYYQDIIACHPEQNEHYNGWKNRAAYIPTFTIPV